MRKSGRILPMFRAVANAIANGGPTAVTIDGQTVSPAADHGGNLWVRLVGTAFSLAQAPNLLQLTQGKGSLLVTNPGMWTVVSDPGVNAQATASRAANAVGYNVCTGIFASFSNNNAAASGTMKVVLRNGTTGAGAIIWEANITAGPNIGNNYSSIMISGLNIIGANATAMTLEFTTAGGANTVETVTLMGYSLDAI